MTSFSGNFFSRSRRLVIKIGSSLLVDRAGRLSPTRIYRLVELVVRLRQEGKQVVLVSSGAVAASRSVFLSPLGKKPTLPERQARSAIGQIYLMEKYRKAFSRRGYGAGQILISKFSINHRRSYLNARNTIHELWGMGAIPIINENDPLATEEFRFGENDILGALVCGLVDADLYLILSHIDGVYRESPSPDDRRKGKDNQVYDVITDLSSEFLSRFTGGTSDHGSGGILAKLEAARLAAKLGVPTLIKNGSRQNLYEHILDPRLGTLISFQEGKISARKKWLLSNVTPKAVILIDAGAAAAISKGKSLLPGGVTEVEGDLEEGDICNVAGPNKKVIARGLSNYSGKDLLLIRGQKSGALPEILGRPSHAEVIHRDNLALWDSHN